MKSMIHTTSVITLDISCKGDKLFMRSLFVVGVA